MQIYIQTISKNENEKYEIDEGTEYEWMNYKSVWIGYVPFTLQMLDKKKSQQGNCSNAWNTKKYHSNLNSIFTFNWNKKNDDLMTCYFILPFIYFEIFW